MARLICSRACGAPRRDPEHEHPGICVCGGFLVDAPPETDGPLRADPFDHNRECLYCDEPELEGHAEDCPWLLAQLQAERPSITCPRCGMVSFHPKDIAERYCGACHQFHPGAFGAPDAPA